MFEGALAIVAALVSLLGFALLALSQERHWCAVTRTAVSARVGRYGPACAGLALQVVALLLDIRSQGPSFGSLLWVLMLSAAAVALALMLSWVPHGLLPVARLLRKRQIAPSQ